MTRRTSFGRPILRCRAGIAWCWPRDEQFSIRDLKSRNGTLVNGVPVEQQQIRHGDQIYIGDSVLIFLLKEDGEHFDKNPVEFLETAGFEGSPLLLRAEDSLYLQPDKIVANLPPSARRARDLNSLLKIATGIGGIRDQDSLQWQLLGFIFDVVPAERGAVLLCDHPEEFTSTAAWDRVRGPGHPVRVSRTVVQRVLKDRIGLLVSDVLGNEALRQVKTLTELKVSSLLCVPLLVGQGPGRHLPGQHQPDHGVRRRSLAGHDRGCGHRQPGL